MSLSHSSRRIATALYCVLLLSCDSESSQIGSDFFSYGSLDISSIDTVSVQLSTIKSDSLVTSGAARTLLGSHRDDKMGRITATTYFRPSLNGTSALEVSGLSFEDLSIVLRYDGYFWYDTAEIQSIHVYRLRDEMELASDGRLYNSTHFAREGNSLGSLTFTPAPHGDDSIEIHLDKAFGEEFFRKAQEQHSDFESDADFRKYIRGFAVVADTSLSSAIVGFQSTPELRLYYWDFNAVPAEKKYIAFSTSTEYAFTEVSANYTHSTLNNLTDPRSRVSATATDNEAYLQAGTGLLLRIDLPYLRDLKLLTNFYVTRTVLQIQPVYRSFDKSKPLPSSLDVRLLDYRNLSLGEYTSDALLREDLFMGRDTYYQIDVTAFVTGQMETQATNENALCLLLPDEGFRVGVDRVCFANALKGYNTRLVVYFATITD